MKDSLDLSFFILHLFFLLIVIETMTAKTGNFKSFSVFVNMLENAINEVGEKIEIFCFMKNYL
jgi:hypothetical protein